MLIDRQLGYGATGLAMLLTATGLGSIGGMAMAGIRPNRRITTLGTNKKYLVFYTISEDALIVLRVVYGGRDLPSIDFPAP